MLLAIDVGNTQTLIGLFLGGSPPQGEPEDPGVSGLIDNWRITTVAERTSDELALMFRQFLSIDNHTLDGDVTGVVVSSVVPRVTAALRQMCERYLDFDAMILEPGVRTGMPILYDNPKEVGADRIANGVGVYDLYGGPSIVVDFGTATTLDAISEKGEYLGGAIFPGIEVSMDALFGRAAGLRKVELVPPRNVIGKSTVESIQSGALYGFSGQVDALVELFQKEMGVGSVIATGGLAELIAPVSRTIQHIEPWLTLHGLRLIYERNK